MTFLGFISKSPFPESVVVVDVDVVDYVVDAVVVDDYVVVVDDDVVDAIVFDFDAVVCVDAVDVVDTVVVVVVIFVVDVKNKNTDLIFSFFFFFFVDRKNLVHVRYEKSD